MAKCTDKEFDEAMINAFGKNYKKVTEADLLASDMSNEKKNEVVKILKFNQLNKLINDEDNVSYNFSVSDVVAEKIRRGLRLALQSRTDVGVIVSAETQRNGRNAKRRQHNHDADVVDQPPPLESCQLSALRRSVFDCISQTPHLYPKPQTVVI